MASAVDAEPVTLRSSCDRWTGGTEPSAQLGTPQLSVVMCTFNRADLLRGAVTSVLAQHADVTPPFELVVVDNNSTDGTREIVHQLASIDDRVRYTFEPQQGLSYARNAGIRNARASLVAFIDDDLLAEPDWIAALVRAFHEYPDVDIVGGRLLPVWPVAPPVWLTRDHWAPLALSDHGDEPIVVTVERPICLVGAGACRREVFDAVGTFATDFQRVRDGIGSLEDHDFMLRVLRTGRKALYDPRIRLSAAVQANRLDRAYHRRWHTGHGHFHALLRSEHIEQTRVGKLMGVPAHLYRQALSDGVRWLRATVAGDSSQAFLYEVRLRFFHGFFRTRVREFLNQSRRKWAAALWRLSGLVGRRRTPSKNPSALGAR
jgi:glycosyltransferase involved in cell wall biosynthesis